MKKLILPVFLWVLAFVSFAQDSTGIRDSIILTEKLIIQEENQKIIDSLVKVQLEKKLKEAQAKPEINELEEKLKLLEEKEADRKIAQQNRILQLKAIGESFAVHPFRDTLFYIHTGTGSFTAADRANSTTERILRLYEDDFFNKDSLKIVTTENAANIVYKSGFIVASFSDLDAMWYETSRETLANEYLEKIAAAIEHEKKQNSFRNQLIRVGWVSLAIIGLLLIIYIINKFFKWFEHYLFKHRKKIFKGISFRSFRLFTPAEQASLVIRFHNILRIAGIIVVLYLSLPVIFNVFPQTQHYAETLLNWIITPAKKIFHSFVAFLPDLTTIIVVFIFTRFLIRIIKYFAVQVEKGRLEIPGFHKDFARTTYGIIRFFLYIFMLIIVFPYLPGSGSPAFQGVSVFLGILISLGSSSSISNMIAGLIITYMRPFKIGDRVKIGDVTGDVIEKTLLVTKIRTIKNEEVTLPNSNVLAANAVNYSSNAEELGLILNTRITVGYKVPWKTNEQLLIKAALKTPMIEHIPVPFVFQLSLDDFYITYQLNAYTRMPNEMDTIYSELHKNIQIVYNEAGIDLTAVHFSTVKLDSSIPSGKEKS
ncbi:MAG: mechanosensitive ion channel [Chitinophagaceae bacterium]|nr:mechanosensitive ion channel [Chitinophagaceae bacterium]MCW5927057.1 mechanosensitive ion channel [Chitinophagaceae bacterium]